MPRLEICAYICIKSQTYETLYLRPCLRRSDIWSSIGQCPDGIRPFLFTIGYIKDDGTVYDRSYSTLGYFKGETIYDRSYSTVGYIKGETIYDRSYSTIGYVKSDGTVYDRSYSTLGYVRDDGTVYDRSYSTLGYAKGINKKWAAVFFFFNRFR